MTANSSTQPVAAVTGGARGIGLAVADLFWQRGWRVALIDIDGATLAATEAERAHQGLADRLYCVQADVSKPDQVERAFASIMARFGRLDALVNNAGVAVFKPVLQTSWEEWRHVLGTNLDGAFLCTQAAAPLMLRNRVNHNSSLGGDAGSGAGGSAGRCGAVVNIASISGLRASTLRVAYGTSKGALIHLTKQHAVELGTQGIRVNCVAPGPVDTEMAKLVHSVAIRSDYHDVIPLNRYGTTEEVAHAVVFLCSDDASYINGQVLAVDGGFEAAGVGLPTLRRG